MTKKELKIIHDIMDKLEKLHTDVTKKIADIHYDLLFAIPERFLVNLDEEEEKI